jgi:anti-sigma factor RsiW
MNAKMKKLKAQIEKAGGQLMISGDIPDELAEILSRTIADCPDCAAAMLASSRQKRRSGHEH